MSVRTEIYSVFYQTFQPFKISVDNYIDGLIPNNVDREYFENLVSGHCGTLAKQVIGGDNYINYRLPVKTGKVGTGTSTLKRRTDAIYNLFCQFKNEYTQTSARTLFSSKDIRSGTFILPRYGFTKNKNCINNIMSIFILFVVNTRLNHEHMSKADFMECFRFPKRTYYYWSTLFINLRWIHKNGRVNQTGEQIFRDFACENYSFVRVCLTSKLDKIRIQPFTLDLEIRIHQIGSFSQRRVNIIDFYHDTVENI